MNVNGFLLPLYDDGDYVFRVARPWHPAQSVWSVQHRLTNPAVTPHRMRAQQM